jgi:hypothetical protein
MTGTPEIGSGLARSLVAALEADCATAANVARAIANRFGEVVDFANHTISPLTSLGRVATDFVERGWLTPRPNGWLVGPKKVPPGLSTFLDGAAEMRRTLGDSGIATAVVTMPPEPSAIGAALPTVGLAHAALISTQSAFERLADQAASRFTIMTPFLNDDGLAFALDLFSRTSAARRCLIVRRSGSARTTIERFGNELRGAGVLALDYTLPTGNGFETFHAKILLADRDLAYVGSANMTAFARHSMELGILADGRTAQVVATVVRAAEKIATPIICS